MSGRDDFGIYVRHARYVILEFFQNRGHISADHHWQHARDDIWRQTMKLKFRITCPNCHIKLSEFFQKFHFCPWCHHTPLVMLMPDYQENMMKPGILVKSFLDDLEKYNYGSGVQIDPLLIHIYQERSEKLHGFIAGWKNLEQYLDHRGYVLDERANTYVRKQVK